MAEGKYTCTTRAGTVLTLPGIKPGTALQYVLALAERLGGVWVNTPGGVYRHDRKNGWEFVSLETKNAKA